jgi:ATP-binding cassette subfamily B protein
MPSHSSQAAPDSSTDKPQLSTAPSASSRPAQRATPPTALKGLLPFLRPYRMRILAALLLLVLAAAATLVFPLALRGLVDGGLATSTDPAQAAHLRTRFLLMFAVAAALALFSAGRFYVVSWLGERVSTDLRNAIYAHVLRQSPEFFETTQSGEVLSRLTADTTLVQAVVGSSLSMGLRNSVMGAGALAILIWTHPYVMLQVLAALLLVVLPSVWFGRRVRRLSRASQDRIADTSAIAAEILAAVPVVQSFTAEQREADRFARSSEFAFTTSVRRSRARSFLVAFVIMATSAALLYGLYEGALAVLAGTMSAGQLGETVVYVIILAGASAALGEVYGDLLRAAGATERLMQLLHQRSSIVSPKPARNENIASNMPAALQAPAAAAIDFDSVNFAYPSRAGTAALVGFDLHIEPGETLALVGTSGAGKTTVFQLLQRFYDLGASGGGAIRVCGRDVRNWQLDDLRTMIGVVPQDATIFSATAAENILYGRPDASRSDVEAAARSAFAHEFIMNLPEGYDTFLGERGVRMSGGQRQRLAIARALLKNAPILLLDEATSALDAESERMVQAALDATLREGAGTRTTLVIAHRLATVQKADRIVVLEHGRLVEQGSHAELIAAGGAYARLASLQFGA